MRKIMIILITLILSISIVFSIINDYKIKNNVNTIILKENNMTIGINYPTINIKKLDFEIKKQVNTIYDDFIKEYSLDNKHSELNIDYNFNITNERYINIVLEKYISNSKNLTSKLYTYVFDVKQNRFLTLKDLINQEELKYISSYVQKELLSKYKDSIGINELNNILSPEYNNFKLFTFNDQKLVLYFNSPNFKDIVDVEIPIENINLKIPIEMGTSIQNTVKVKKIKNKVIDPNKKMIALTFDDGPSKYTDKIIDLLDKYDASGTFFVLGNKVEMYKETLIKMVEQGSEIGNHSYNHKWLIKLNKDDFLNQVNQTQSILKNTIGYTPTLLRPTYGSVNDEIKNNTTLDIILWNIDTLDWKLKNYKDIVNRVVGKVKDGDIVLMHDIHERTLKALEIILPKLKEEGYQFVTVSELKKAQELRNYE